MEWNGMEWNGMEWNGMGFKMRMRSGDNTLRCATVRPV
jgi:hypothetical protein